MLTLLGWKSGRRSEAGLGYNRISKLGPLCLARRTVRKWIGMGLMEYFGDDISASADSLGTSCTNLFPAWNCDSAVNALSHLSQTPSCMGEHKAELRLLVCGTPQLYSRDLFYFILKLHGLWNMGIQCRIRKGLPNNPYPVPNQHNSSHCLSPVGLPVKIFKALLSFSILAIRPAQFNFLDLIALTTNYEVPHNGFFSTIHSYPSWIKIFASKSCFQIPLSCVPPLV